MPLPQTPTLLLGLCVAFFTLARVHASPYPDARKRVPHLSPYPPTFRTYANNPDFPDPALADARLRQAWIDMWYLAAVACVTLDEQEELYQRYFEGGESEMVRSTLRRSLALYLTDDDGRHLL